METQSSKQTDSWMNRKWRPAMAWVYMVTIIFDFILFPIFWGILLYKAPQEAIQWVPITLANGGLFHVAMGTIIGIATWKRSEEKKAGVSLSGHP